MRVVSGKYKGRRFDIPRTFKARPTTDFAKENIFNVLANLIDFEDTDNALDLFAGTGSISIEMLSRGCGHVTSVEKDRDHFAFIKKVSESLKVTNHTAVLGDVFRFVERYKGRPFGLVFADPPYTLTNIDDIPSLVLGSGILAPDGIFVMEHGKHNDFSTLPDFDQHRSYGSVNFSIFRNKAAMQTKGEEL